MILHIISYHIISYHIISYIITLPQLWGPHEINIKHFFSPFFKAYFIIVVNNCILNTMGVIYTNLSTPNVRVSALDIFEAWIELRCWPCSKYNINITNKMCCHRFTNKINSSFCLQGPGAKCYKSALPPKCAN